jgi:hypothetical protein
MKFFTVDPPQMQSRIRTGGVLRYQKAMAAHTPNAFDTGVPINRTRQILNDVPREKV